MANPFLIQTVATVIITASLLTGCGPQPSFADRCANEGYEPGTSLMLDCINQKHQAVAMFLGNMQRQQQQNYQQQMQFYQRPTINCLSNRMGDLVSTSCN